MLVNLSLGISVVEAVRLHGLSSADFAPSDPTVDMLYVIEAKSVALDASRRLNERLKGAKTAAEEQALTDMLTGLRNRRAMEAELPRLVRAGTPFGLMHLDLDYFKQINDTMGHSAGDHVLRHVASVLMAETRNSDLVARVGGDEFVMIVSDCVDLTTLDRIACRIISNLEQPSLFEGRWCRVSASIGTTLSSYYSGDDIHRMLSDADIALYMSKDRGRARHTFFKPDTDRMIGPEKIGHATP